MARNRFSESWENARERGIRKDDWARSLGLSRHAADDLTSGRRQPTLGLTARSLGRHDQPWLVRWQARDDSIHGFYVGEGMTYDELVESGLIEEIAESEAEEAHYEDFDRIVSITPREPKREGIRVWNARTKRRNVRRR